MVPAVPLYHLLIPGEGSQSKGHGVQPQAQGTLCRSAPSQTRALVQGLTLGTRPGSVASRAAPAAREAPTLERAVGVERRRLNQAGVTRREAQEAQEAGTASSGLRTGQQRHLLGRHVRRRGHRRLGVAPQLP